MKLSRAFIPLILLPLLSGCGRMYTLVGRVVISAADVLAKPGIHEVTGQPMPSSGAPVAGARITLFHELDSGGSPIRTSIWQRDLKTDQRGEFHLSDYGPPGRKHMVGLEVKAAGYSATYTTYWDYVDPDHQYFFVVLVPAV